MKELRRIVWKTLIPLLALDIFNCNIHKQVTALKVIGEECNLLKQTLMWKKGFTSIFKGIILFVKNKWIIPQVSKAPFATLA